MLHFIYELVDPRTDVAAYVGISNNPNQRFRAHLTDIETNVEKQTWIEQLRKEHLEPRMRILEIVDTREEALAREEYWIRYYLKCGTQLTNLQCYGLKQKDKKKPEKNLPTVEAQQKTEQSEKIPQQASLRSTTKNADEYIGKKRERIFIETKDLYYTAREAAKKLRITHHAFHYRVRIGEIPRGVTFPLRKQAVYRKRDIDLLAKAWNC